MWKYRGDHKNGSGRQNGPFGIKGEVGSSRNTYIPVKIKEDPLRRRLSFQHNRPGRRRTSTTV